MNEEMVSTKDDTSSNIDREHERSLKNITTFVYALQALSFFFGITFIVAVIINYVKMEDTGSTWLRSHFRWQIRTFWYGVFWSIIGMATFFIVIGYIILVVNALWVLYRIVKGWLRLVENHEMYPDV